MTFAITTKSGRSVNIKADNYKEAQKYADRHFGKGCIVQLVGNAAAACEDHPASSNAIVNAALAWKEKAAANAKFKVGDYVLYEGHGEGYRRGRIVSLGGTIGPAGCVVEWVGGGRDSVPYARLTPCNSAESDPTVAANAGVREGNYQVTIETVDFSGNRTQSKNLTASQLKTWLSLIHCDGSDQFLDEIASSSRREVQFFLDMHPTIKIKAM